MKDLSIDLRRRVVNAYRAGISGSYQSTAKLFEIGEATVSRLLRRHRETGDVLYRPRGGNNPRRVDLGWLRKHAQKHPDARLSERISAWKESGRLSVSVVTMSRAMKAIGWSFKKKHQWHESETKKESKSSARRSWKNSHS
jgi:transposase